LQGGYGGYGGYAAYGPPQQQAPPPQQQAAYGGYGQGYPPQVFPFAHAIGNAVSWVRKMFSV